eukprot:3439405-Rhodomonas_salina.3
MPGLPAAGGWGGSNRTLGIEMEGFTEEEIAKAVDYCDNDKVKSAWPPCIPMHRTVCGSDMLQQNQDCGT